MTMRTANPVLLAALLAALAGCGNSDASKSTSPAAASRTAASPVSATAEEVAEEARGNVRCPAKVKSPARAAQAPVDDILGVRPGMTYEEAANVVMCTHDLMVVSADSTRGLQLQTYGQTVRQGFEARFAKPRVEKTSKQIMQELQDNAMARGSNRVTRDLQPGEAKWFVGAMGVPEHERVISAAREEWFEEGRNPTVASVEQALVAKYGTPTRNQPAGDRKHLTWAYDPLGRLVTETSPLFHRCIGTADPNGGANFSPDCGIVVAAVIAGMRDNAALAQFMQVGVVDQAGGYEAVSATELSLQQSDARRQAEQVDAATKNAGVPKL